MRISDCSSDVCSSDLQLSGGAETMDYFVNFSYFDQQGLYKNGDINYDRYNFRANLNADITKGIRAELKINGMTDSRNRPYEESINFWKAAWRSEERGVGKEWVST